MKLAGGLLLLTAAPAAAQWPGDQLIPPVNYPTILKDASTAEGLVPKGWKLEAKALGDLNSDKLPDAALVLHMDDPANRIAPAWDDTMRYDTNPRMLIVAFGKGSGYELAVAEHKLIPRLENPNQDEPFDEVKIVNGTLHVTMHLFLSAGGWRMGESAFTFRWQDGAFRLIGFDRDDVMRSTGATEEMSINYLTRTKILKTGNIGSNDEKKRTVRIAKKPLTALGDVGDGLSFDPGKQ